MIFTDLYETTGHRGYDNLRRLLQGVKNSSDVELIVANEPITLTYPEARFLAGQYRAFQKSGRQQEFLQHLTDPVWFDAHMAKLRGMIDRQRALGEMEIDINPNDIQSNIERERTTQQMTQQDAAAAGLAEEEKKGLYYYVNKRKKAGTSRPKGHPKAPSAQDWKDAAKTAKTEGVEEGSETHKYQVVVKGQERSYSVWVEAKNEEVAIIRAQQYVAREHNDTAKRAAVVDMKQGVAEGSLVDKQVAYWDSVAKDKKNKEREALKAKKEKHEKTPTGKAEKYWSKKGVAEAGPFSYGAKKPRKGSVADLAAKKRREQERGKPPIEPRDQMVGVAKILPKDVAEANPNQQMSLYNPDGKTYRQEKMPGYDSDDIFQRGQQVDYDPEYGVAAQQDHYDDQHPEAFNSMKRFIAAHIDTLPPKYKQILVLRYFKEKTIEQIAQEFGIAKGTVRQFEGAALRALRRRFEDDDVEFYKPTRRTTWDNVEEEKQRLDPKCWKGKKIGNPKTKMKGGVRVNNCVPAESIGEDIDGEYNDEAGMAHTNLITIARAAQGLLDVIDQNENLPEWVQEKIARVEGMLVTAWDYLKSQEAQGIDPRISEMFSRLSEDWQKVNKRDKTDGMSQKAVNAYRRENPGSKLKTAVTTKPSKLKRGSKASKRRSSYCSRSAGQKKMHHIDCSKTPDKAICKARRRWNCEESINEGQVKEIAIQYQDYKHLPEMAFQSRYKISKRDWWAKYGSMVQGSGLGIGLDETHCGSKRSAAEKLKQNLKRAGYDMDERERYWKERLKKVNQDIEQWNADNPEHQIKKSKTDESLKYPGEYHHYERDPITGKVMYRGIRGGSEQPKTPHEYPDNSQARAQRRYDRQEPKVS